MAKTKTPFLSLGSSGTVGGVLTSQKSGGVTILRKTPVPTDPYSLAQAYQRWDYRDNAHLWTLLTDSQKQVYRTAASRYHITGFSLWMREHLKDLPALAGRWHLDEKSGATAHDSSRNTNHGTIFGSLPAAGIIDGAFSFDNIDDYIDCGTDPSLNPRNTLTYEFLFYPLQTYASLTAAAGNLVTRNATILLEWLRANGRVAGWARNKNNALTYFSGATVLSPNTLYHIAITLNLTFINLFINAVADMAPKAFLGPVFNLPNQPFYIHIPSKPVASLMDEVAIHSAELPLATIKRHSERRYP